MLSWGNLIWIFFPIPFLSLVLLSIPGPRRLEKLGWKLVEKIFFTRIRAGPIRIHLLWLFFLMSIGIFANSMHRLKQNGVCTTCKFHAETIWYTKALKFRAERNFWLSLFTCFLWLLVWEIYKLKTFIIQLKEQNTVLKSELAKAVESFQKEREKADNYSLTDKKND